jgi:hypothetical protein
MNKLSRADVAEVLSSVAPTLRAVAAERDMLRDKVAAYERREEATKVASMMVEKGISNDPFEQIVGRMEKAAEMNELDRIRTAIELTGPDMGEKVARMVDSGESAAALAAQSDFERYLLGSVG